VPLLACRTSTRNVPELENTLQALSPTMAASFAYRHETTPRVAFSQKLHVLGVPKASLICRARLAWELAQTKGNRVSGDGDGGLGFRLCSGV
jgi:hypothetical protein